MITNKFNHGFSLVEAMITLGVMSVLALGISSMMYNQQREQKAVQAKATYNSLITSIQAAAANPKTMLDSASGNSKVPQSVGIVLDQINTSQTGATYLLGVSPEQELTLAQAYSTSPGSMTIANPNLNNCLKQSGGTCDLTIHPLRIFQGNTEVTGFYDFRGKKCGSETKDCIFHLYANYTATCPPDLNGIAQTNCAKPISLKINYFVKQYNTPKGLTPLPTVSTLDAGRLTAEIPYTAIYSQAYSATTCTTGQIVKGTDSYGQPICVTDPNAAVIANLAAQVATLQTQANNAMLTVTGDKASCPTGKTVYSKQWKAKTCTSSVSPACTTPVMFSLTPPTCVNSTPDTSYQEWQPPDMYVTVTVPGISETCTADSWSAVQCY